MSGPVAPEGAGDYTELRLRIPARFAHQLVFRAERSLPFDVQPIEGLEFQFCRRLRAYWSLAGPLRRVTGTVEMLKGMARILRGRMFYCVRSGESLLHTGWATVSFCRHYKVGRGEVVIGPIWSSAEARGRGIATYATKRAMNELIARGHSVFFIDTSNSNISCIKVIEKCEFEDPIATYLR